MKKLIAIFTIFSISFFSFATSLTFQDESYTGTIIYNEEAENGEAIFARMNLKFFKNIKKKNTPDIRAQIQLLNTEKKVESSNFYIIPQKSKKQNIELLAGLPLSTWLDAKKNYQLKIIISVSDLSEKEFFVPFTLKEAKINSEIIDLNAENTEIKQNMSSERLAQIEKLNKSQTKESNQNKTLLNKLKKLEGEVSKKFQDKFKVSKVIEKQKAIIQERDINKEIKSKENETKNVQKVFITHTLNFNK